MILLIALLVVGFVIYQKAGWEGVAAVAAAYLILKLRIWKLFGFLGGKFGAVLLIGGLIIGGLYVANRLGLPVSDIENAFWALVALATVFYGAKVMIFGPGKKAAKK
ncbi:MAG: hypothetical protein HY978_03705 [Candidatus Liptonbacteria bacterium]|nr:hypothetical protein [Candidatus Liptonbacteria bacterium]